MYNYVMDSINRYTYVLIGDGEMADSLMNV